MNIRRICKLFANGNVCVTGMRGTGKDVLFGNVIARNERRKTYASNLNYGGRFVPIDFARLDMGKNTYRDFISGDLAPFVYSYPMGTNVYISDAGVYFPAQYCNELNRQYQYLPAYFALSRQVSHNNIHVNAQNLNRVWDKIREQSDTYLLCRWCKVLFGKVVIQLVTEYDRVESCLERLQPCRLLWPSPTANKEARAQIQTYLDNFYNQHGKVKNHLLVYWNRSKHDTYYFEEVLRLAKKDSE